MLSGRRVLIVEDEMLVAFELAEAIGAAGGEVVALACANRDALEVLGAEEVDIALLDASLADGDVTPTAERLAERGVPFLVYTGGALPRGLRLCWPETPVLTKPAEPTRIVQALASLVG